MTFLKVLIVSIIAVVAGILLTTTMEPAPSLGFPWQIEKQTDGTIKVFQINLGHTTLSEAEKLLKESAKITLFSPKQGSAVIEAYFNELFIGGLKAKMVLTFEVGNKEVEGMFERGLRISTLGSGTRKVTLHTDDEARMREKAVSSLTYLPSINLQTELLEKRFGVPAEKIKDTVGGADHWLYPDLGLDIALSNDSKEVLQYISPKDFSKITDPLKQTESSSNQQE